LGRSPVAVDTGGGCPLRQLHLQELRLLTRQAAALGHRGAYRRQTCSFVEVTRDTAEAMVLIVTGFDPQRLS